MKNEGGSVNDRGKFGMREFQFSVQFDRFADFSPYQPTTFIYLEIQVSWSRTRSGSTSFQTSDKITSFIRNFSFEKTATEKISSKEFLTKNISKVIIIFRP